MFTFLQFLVLHQILADMVISASHFQYGDTQMESRHYSFSKCTKIAIAALNQVGRNWFALLEEVDF